METPFVRLSAFGALLSAEFCCNLPLSYTLATAEETFSGADIDQDDNPSYCVVQYGIKVQYTSTPCITQLR